MVLSQPPITAKVIEETGFISREWSEWLTKLTAVLNNTDTKTFLTGVSPTTTGDITYIKGE